MSFGQPKTRPMADQFMFTLIAATIMAQASLRPLRNGSSRSCRIRILSDSFGCFQILSVSLRSSQFLSDLLRYFQILSDLLSKVVARRFSGARQRGLSHVQFSRAPDCRRRDFPTPWLRNWGFCIYSISPVPSLLSSMLSYLVVHPVSVCPCNFV